MQKMQRSMNMLALLFASVGTMIGSGWLFGPLYAAQIAGPAAIISWFIGGSMVIVVALTLGELATMFPIAGSVARFPQFSHGAFVSYIIAWMSWVSYLLLAPTEVFALLQYASTYSPHLMHLIDGRPVLTNVGFLVATVLLVLMSFLNILGIKAITRCNTPLVVFKLLVPIVTAITLLCFSFHPGNLIHHGGFIPHGVKSIFDALPLAGIVFSFFGFRAAIDLAGEAENPQKTLPIALIGSLLLCTAIYCLVQLAFITAIPEKLLAQGWQGLHFAGDAGPLAGLTAALGIVFLMFILYVNAFVAPLGSALIMVTTTSRINYAMSRNGYAPKFFAKLNDKNAPYYCIVFNLVCGLLLMRCFPGWQKLAEFVISSNVLSHAAAPLSLVALRRQVPDYPRAFKLPMSTFISFLAFFILNLLAYWTGWSTLQKMLIALGVGVVVLVLYRFWQTLKNETKPPLHLEEAIWLVPYFAGISLISYYGHFGEGLKKIPLGADVLLIALLSLFVLWLATQYRLSDEETLKQIESGREELS